MRFQSVDEKLAIGVCDFLFRAPVTALRKFCSIRFIISSTTSFTNWRAVSFDFAGIWSFRAISVPTIERSGFTFLRVSGSKSNLVSPLRSIASVCITLTTSGGKNERTSVSHLAKLGAEFPNPAERLPPALPPFPSVWSYRAASVASISDCCSSKATPSIAGASCPNMRRQRVK